jgi:hypothetical protein
MNDWTALASATSASVVAILAILGFVLAQAKSLRELIAAGDKAMAEAESKARHGFANAVTAAQMELRRDVEMLKREAFLKTEARDLEQRLGTLLGRIEAKVDRQGEQLGALMALETSIRMCSEQIKGVMGRLDQRAA